jgi:hypothetical protein
MRRMFCGYIAASRSYSAAMDRRMAARFECGVAWTFACKMHQIKKSSEFKLVNMAANQSQSGIPLRAAGCYSGDDRR